MPIIDERRVTFDLDALKEVVKFSPFAALSIGLPDNLPSDIDLNGSAGTVNFDFAGTLVTLASDRLGSLLISYCIRCGIKVPRQGKRSVIIEGTAITLVFHEDYLTTPVPKSDQARPNVTSRTYQYERLSIP
jgi:hypothetical protein